ncbi:hypothetical protein DPMN_135691 [Dreissena polymorpha]|uniref:Uncharacterized protein n=1 Tax=Dreissena polymorpha TaxID=45954 RepID=A0A9D4FYL6_DREPO|nr:hypothetical protein DPMN_135691 [Dreissena polymorpha]
MPLIWLFSPTHTKRCRKDKHGSGKLSSTWPHHRRREELGVQKHTSNKATITVQCEALKEMDSFIYINSILDNQGGTDACVSTRIGKA